jgi:hypothetical protein
MYRKLPTENPRLEKLLDERDHLKIQMHLAGDEIDPDALKDMRERLRELEREIDVHWRAASRTG